MTRTARRIGAKLVPGLPARGMTGREIRSTGHISQRSIKLAGEAADKAGLTWGDVADMPDHEACGLIFPAQGEAQDAYAEPDWEWARPGPRRDGVTPGLPWEEHRDEAARDGLVPRSHDALCRGPRGLRRGQGRRQPPRAQARPGHGGGPGRHPHVAHGRGHGRVDEVPPVRRDPALLAARLLTATEINQIGTVVGILNQNSRGTAAAGSRPPARPSLRGRFPRTCEPPARRPRAPACMSSWLTGGCRSRGMHDGWPWGPSRRSGRLGAVLPRRNHPGSREVPLGPRPRDKFHSLSSGHIV